jgi:hypothetical protein
MMRWGDMTWTEVRETIASRVTVVGTAGPLPEQAGRPRA